MGQIPHSTTGRLLADNLSLSKPFFWFCSCTQRDPLQNTDSANQRWVVSWSMPGSCKMRLTCVWQLNPDLNPSLEPESSPDSRSKTGSQHRPHLKNGKETNENRVPLMHFTMLLFWPIRYFIHGYIYSFGTWSKLFCYLSLCVFFEWTLYANQILFLTSNLVILRLKASRLMPNLRTVFQTHD